MPYLRLSSLPLDDATKRHLADELTATVLDILPEAKPEWTSVHFTPFAPEDFAIAGRLVSDGGIADTHLDISAPEVDERRWFALRNRLTDVLIESLGIPDGERWHVNVKLNRYDPHTFSMAGNAADELPAAAGRSEPAGRGAVRGAAVWLGFALGLCVAYAWLSRRVGSEASVDVAPPTGSATG
jgi:phenylpyruvate tautomerase PptA (4-oxalocrotonate tautomerase family)